MGLRRLGVILSLLFAAASLATQARAADPLRIALIIGNASYREAPLRNPVNDAKAMTEALTERGFSVIYRQNATKAEMESAIADFGERLEEGATGLFYFAGHGMQVNGRNFLIPVDAEIRSEQRVRLTTIDVDVVLDQMAAAQSRINLVILDACRNNPFERRFRTTGGGLAQINAPEGTLIAYATAPGKVAADGAGANGLYTEELVRAIRAPGLKVEEVFKAVRASVTRRSNGAQTPWEASSLVGDFYFSEPRTVPLAPPSPLAARQALELALWDAVKDSGSAAELKAYLEQFPKGTFAPLARTRIAALAGGKPEPGPPAPQAAAPAGPSLPGAEHVPGLGAEGREAYAKFLAGAEHRAFAIAAGGTSGWSSGNADPNRATWNAAFNCTRAARSLCRIFALNSERQTDAYDSFDRESALALARLKPGAVTGAFRDEDRDFGIPPRKEPKGDSYHADTPTTLPGASTISTAALATALAGRDKPLLLDTLDGNRHRTLPGAFWLRGAGNVKAEGNARMGELLTRIVQDLAGSKDAPIVVFCLSSQCWLSYNAALRLAGAGFSRVQWYRGGIEAWRAAGLPVVQSVIHAQF